MPNHPPNFGFNEDATMLRDSARKLFADKCSPAQLHALVAANPDAHRPIECLWDPSLWQQIVELGWPATIVPEAAGGVGMPLVAAVALAEEAGKAACPSPLVSTFWAAALLKACGTEAAQQALGEIAAGKASALAITNQQGSWEPEDTDVECKGGKLQGTAWYVQEAAKSMRFVVSAKSGKGVGLYLAEAGGKGVKLVPDGIIDLTRDQAHLEFKDAPCIELAPPGDGVRAISDALPSILALLAADMAGAGEWLLQTTADYAKTRIQFDRPLGFFQAVKHPLVNVMLEVDRAKSLAYHAACAIDAGDRAAERYARMAKAQASDMAVFSASRAVQFHGGIGFTWECYVHLWFKRQMHSQVLFGDAKHHRTRLAELIIGKAAAAA